MFASRFAAFASAACLVLAPTVAFADVGESAQKQFGSDGKNLENAKMFESLMGPDSHFRVHVGLWFATLGQSFGASLVNSGNDAFAGNGSVGAGHGTLRDLGLALSVKGNEAFFSYLDDKLLSAADDSIDAHVQNGTARSIFKQLVGQLKPNLKDVLGDHELSFRVVYGTVQGVITNPGQFAGIDNRLFTPGAEDSTWQSSLFAGEIAVDLAKFSEGDDDMDCIGSCGYSGYARYTSFHKPIPLGLSPEGETGNARETLQDVGLGVYELGIRATASFGDTLKFSYTAGFGGGYAKVDMGQYGHFGSGVISTEVEARLSYELDLGAFGIAPYASFRYLELSPMAQLKSADTDPDAAPGGPARAQVSAPALGYSLWGPTLGIEGVL